MKWLPVLRRIIFAKNTYIQGVPKKDTNRMLLEPWCTGSITSGRHPMCLEIVFWSFLTKTKQDQAYPSHFEGGNLTPQHSILVRISFCHCEESCTVYLVIYLDKEAWPRKILKILVLFHGPNCRSR